MPAAEDQPVSSDITQLVLILNQNIVHAHMHRQLNYLASILIIPN